jgi:hypothetical protein
VAGTITTSVIPSGSTNGRPIAITATSSPGTTLHTASATSGVQDEVWVWLVNNADSVARQVSIQLGGTSASDLIEIMVPAGRGEVLAIAGARLNGGVVVKAFVDALPSGNLVNARVNVNRITDNA